MSDEHSKSTLKEVGNVSTPDKALDHIQTKENRGGSKVVDSVGSYSRHLSHVSTAHTIPQNSEPTSPDSAIQSLNEWTVIQNDATSLCNGGTQDKIDKPEEQSRTRGNTLGSQEVIQRAGEVNQIERTRILQSGASIENPCGDLSNEGSINNANEEERQGSNRARSTIHDNVPSSDQPVQSHTFGPSLNHGKCGSDGLITIQQRNIIPTTTHHEDDDKAPESQKINRASHGYDLKKASMAADNNKENILATGQPKDPWQVVVSSASQICYDGKTASGSFNGARPKTPGHHDERSLPNEADVSEDVAEDSFVMVSNDEIAEGDEHRTGIYTKVVGATCWLYKLLNKFQSNAAHILPHTEIDEVVHKKLVDDIPFAHLPSDNVSQQIPALGTKRVRKLMQSVAPETTIEATYETKSGIKIHIIQGDITRLAVDAVVNAANCRLSHDGGVARAISKAAGPQLQEECTRHIRANGTLPTCGIFTSKAYDMPCCNVIHVVGPKWSDYEDKEMAVRYLGQCFIGVLSEANRLNLQCIAIPAVGSGVYGSPIATVAQQMFEGVKSFVSGCSTHTLLRDIILVDINAEIIKLLTHSYQQAVERGSVKMMPSECERFNGHAQNKDAPRPHSFSQELTERQGDKDENIAIYSSQTRSKVEPPLAGLGSIIHSGLKMIGLSSNHRVPTDTKWRPNSADIKNIMTTTQNHSGPQRKNIILAEEEPSNDTCLSDEPFVLVETSHGSLSKEQSTAADHDLPTGTENEDCAICMESPTDRVVLPICKHVFCKECIDTWFKNKPTCPNCGQIHGEMKGDQPDGTITTNRLSTKLAGFYNDSIGTIEINYSFRGGTQLECHPNPGRLYHGTRRTAYLPDNDEGNDILDLLRRAFDAKLTFTIGRSTTTGREDQITWNDIHHKTNMSGGPARFGYPDPTYLSRVKEELAAKGIQ